ncbi:MAG: class II aldolase/adducin family protein [Candidatus Puniceispirillaceae bacterium]
MTISDRSFIEAFCHELGTDPLWVQGAGGNASWKESNTLWVKASGTRMADALTEDIFVPVDLPLLQRAILEKNFGITPTLKGDYKRRSSIETMMHGLMPHKYVLHVHAVDSLSVLVQSDPKPYFDAKLPSHLNWILVDYKMPGADLSSAIAQAADDLESTNILLLKNHGVVFAANSREHLKNIVFEFSTATKRQLGFSISQENTVQQENLPAELEGLCSWVSDYKLQQLAIDPTLYARVQNQWVLYPDHAVFLGAEAYCMNWTELERVAPKINIDGLNFIFIEGVGVLEVGQVGRAVYEQLHCYADVICRVPKNAKLQALKTSDIAQLLDWDAEKYRQKLAGELL